MQTRADTIYASPTGIDKKPMKASCGQVPGLVWAKNAPGACIFYGVRCPVHSAADLPVEQPTKFDLVINLKTAKQMIVPSRFSQGVQAQGNSAGGAGKRGSGNGERGMKGSG